MYLPLISIIIPVHNSEDYLDKCVHSVVSQTYRHLEIILINDGSTDTSGERCDRWKDRDDRIRVIHRSGGGPSAARNDGLRICSGEIIGFVDSDDWIEPEMIEKMLMRMQRDRSDIVVCAYRRVKESGEVESITDVPDTIVDTRQALSELIAQRAVKQTVWNKLYRKDVIKDVFFEPGKIYEDIFWTYRVITRAKRVSLMSDVFYSYYMSKNSITHTAYSERNLDALDAYWHCCEIIRVQFPDFYDDMLTVYMAYCLKHMQDALKARQSEAVIRNIKSRLSYRKTGHPTKKLNFRQKLMYASFWRFPVMTARFINIFKP